MSSVYKMNREQLVSEIESYGMEVTGNINDLRDTVKLGRQICLDFPQKVQKILPDDSITDDKKWIEKYCKLNNLEFSYEIIEHAIYYVGVGLFINNEHIGTGKKINQKTIERTIKTAEKLAATDARRIITMEQ